MSTLYLHMGMPKTGTTYIQNFMNKNNAVLNTKGYTYPRFERIVEGIGANRNAHFMLCKIYDGKNRDHKKEQEFFEDGFREIGKFFEQYPNVVLSEEALWNSAEKNFNGNLWNDLKAKSEEMNFDVKFVVYLRRQDLFAQSYWAQQVKETYTKKFDEFLKSEKHKFLNLDYYERLNQIAEVFGKENILVRVYERSQFTGTDNSLVSDFLETIGLELTDEYQLLNKERVNRSLNGVYLETKRKMNAFPEFKKKMNFFTQYLYKVIDLNEYNVKFDSNQLFSYQELKDYMSNFNEGNSLVAKEYLGREDGVLFQEPLAVDEDTQATTYKSKDLYGILGQVIALENVELTTAVNNNLKKQSTIEWMNVPFYVKFFRKFKTIYKKIKRKFFKKESVLDKLSK